MRYCKKCCLEKPEEDFYKKVGRCKRCTLDAQAVYYESNREKICERVRSYISDNQEKIDSDYQARKQSGYFKNYYQKPDVITRQRKFYTTPSQRAKSTSREMRRQAAKINATPAWLSPDQKKNIENFYWLASDLEKVTGQKYHVDHIMPLRGKNVCGLHVPWNLQILPADVNCSKGNRL